MEAVASGRDHTSRRLRTCLARERRIEELQRQINRLQAEIIELTAAAEADRSFAFTGAVTTADWLVAATNVTARTARSWVRVARKLEDLPDVANALRAGDVGVEQVAALVRFVETDEPVHVRRDYFATPADELAEVARFNRTMPPERVRDRRFDRYHHGRYSDNGLMYEYEGALPAADGAVLDKAVRRLAARDRIDEHGAYKLADHAQADAMVEMASQALGRESDPDRATVVVHVDAAALASPDRAGRLEEDAVVPVHSVRRMLCDGRAQLQLDGPKGAPVGVGRVQRTVPPWLQRMVRDRDRTCRFPGCARRRWVHSHHMTRWADGGATDLDNLITLCGFHHRVLHEECWSVRYDESGRLEWTTTHDLVYHDLPLTEPVKIGERLRRMAAGPSPGSDPPA